MNRETHNNLTSPIIGRCVLLVRSIVQYTAKSPNSIKHPYVDTLKADAGRLFKQAMSQLKGKDYYKRATELLEEIQAQIYLIHAVGGLSKRKACRVESQLILWVLQALQGVQHTEAHSRNDYVKIW